MPEPFVPRVLLLADPAQEPPAACGALWSARCAHPEEVQAAISESPVVIVARLPYADLDIRTLLRELCRYAVGCPVILWCPRMSTPEVVSAIQLGAFQVVTDQQEPNHLEHCIRTALDFVRSRGAVARTAAGDAPAWQRMLIGESWPMQVVKELIGVISPRRCTVLILGETGTGKEVVARSIHEASPRRDLPMVSVNCGAIPEELLEAELFGHVKGAYTGAHANRIGRLEQAHRSTLFLDEVGEMPASVQVKLLRVLQEREFQRLGSSETVKVDVRVIAATNAELEERVRVGKFRQDLYYRLNVAPIQLPTLRQRKEDVPLLALHFIQKICRAEGIPEKEISSALLEWLSTFSWPGNVRQLENTVETAVALSGNRQALQLADFSRLITAPAAGCGLFIVPPQGMDYNEVVDQFERSILERALQITDGSKKKAAAFLKLKRTTFAAKLRSLGVAVAFTEEEEVEELAV